MVFEGLISFFFLCFGIFTFFFFRANHRRMNFPFLILRFDLMLSFATHALIYIPILSSDTRAKKVFASAPIINLLCTYVFSATPFRVNYHSQAPK